MMDTFVADGTALYNGAWEPTAPFPADAEEGQAEREAFGQDIPTGDDSTPPEPLLEPDTASAFVSPADAPIQVEHQLLEEKPDGARTVPGARVALAPSLRSSGLLAALSDEAARTLLAVLSFCTANGRIAPTAGEVADVLGVGEAKARERLGRLAGMEWQGGPVLRPLRRESGLDAYTPSRHVVLELASAAGTQEAQAGPPTYRAAVREAVIAHSRFKYARPRAEVERMVLEQLGHAPEEADETPEGEARRRMARLGVSREEADLLLAQHSLEGIIRQLDWLPYREAKNPARLFVAAVQGDYDPPARVRLEQAIVASERVGTGSMSAAPHDAGDATDSEGDLTLPGQVTAPPSSEDLIFSEKDNGWSR